MKRVLSFGFLLLLIAFIWGCQTQPQAIRLGASLPLTGNAAVYGQALKDGIELALEEHNASSKRKIQIVFEDDQGLPAQSIAAIQKLISIEKVPAIIGGAMSSTAEPITSICNQNQIVLLSPTATKPSLTDANPYFFRIWPSDNYDGAVMADVAYNQVGIRKIAILYVAVAYGEGITEVFKNEFQKLGGEILAIDSYAQGATDFRSQLTKLKSLKPEAIYLPGYVTEVSNILKQAQQIGLETRFLGVNSLYDPNLIKIAGTAAEGAVFTYPTYDPNSKDRSIKSFVDAFQSKFGKQPDAFAAQGYDALRLLIKAIELGGGSTGPQIREGLFKIKDYVGPGGIVNFLSNGDVEKPLRTLTVKNGQFVEFKTGV